MKERHMIFLPAIRTGVEIIMGKRFSDFIQERLGYKQGAACLTRFHLDISDLLFRKNLEEPFKTELMSQFRSVFGAGINTGPTAYALIVRVIEDAKFPLIFRFQGSGWATDFTGSAPGTSAFVEPGPAKEKGNENKHGLTR